LGGVVFRGIRISDAEQIQFCSDGVFGNVFILKRWMKNPRSETADLKEYANKRREAMRKKKKPAAGWHLRVTE